MNNIEKSNSNTPGTSLALRLEIGDSIITPSVEQKFLDNKKYYYGSLTGGDFFKYIDGIDAKDSKINLATLLKNFDVELEESLAEIVDFDISELDFGWYPEDEAGWLHISTAYLSVTLLSVKKSTTETSSNSVSDKRHTLLSIASTYEQDLTEIMPLVDAKSLPTMQLKNASIIYASSNFDQSIKLEEYLPEKIRGGLSAKSNPGFSIAVEVDLDDMTIPLVLPLQRSTAKSKALADAKISAAENPLDGSDDTPKSSNTSASVGRSLGPITVNGLGLAYQDGELILGMDGALNLANFQMYLLDMNLKLNVKALMSGDLDGLSFDLSGLYLDLQTSGFSLSGGFLRKTIDDGHGASRDEYLGQLSLKTKALSLTALGIYSQLDNGDQSLFAYLALNMPIGGDPAFFVEGLALGFGYNRDVLVPPVNEVNEFPLVTALGGDPIGDSGVDDSKSLAIVRKRFDALSKYLPAVSGQYLVCAGIHFNTYKQVESTAVLMVEFGQNLGIHLVGISDMRLPMAVDNPVIAIEMAYRMSFDMAEGVVSLQAQLTDNSYVLSRRCRLTGGFAFSSWFNGEHKGDFVVSMGGYHPDFYVPDHYPSVPRLGISWQVSDSIYFKGEMYAALTPIAIMAGAGVSANLSCGRVKAWFNADMNFIIYWQPFHYQAHFGVAIGAEVTLGWGWLSKTFRAELSAKLDVYGPDFSGEAEVHWIIFSFSFDFGSRSNKAVEAITWRKFETEQIPPIDKQLDASITKGVREESKAWSLIDPDIFELKVSSIIPLNNISLNGNNHFDNAKAVNIAPMGGVKISQEDWEIDVEVTGSGASSFVISPENKRYPKAVWGKDLVAKISEKGTTVDLLSGLVITPELTAPPGFTEALNASDFSFSDLEESDANWQWGEAIKGDFCHDATKNSEKIKNTLTTQAVKDQRKKVVDFFDLDCQPTVNLMKNDLESAFIGTPLTQSAAL
ncbi:hypothetical protein EDC56_2147 [Sinobacterium caligoides]|uniref:DUF6603 domain-containing protein n=1 Tax=Sinobacterium caligoides TaxID=933926 RepID=A0A3N2DPU5_9GAMM|nr:DUF6603 domain-containing protein [Sinobacterium caligoides]ROS01702.1 hypothetical protein EDC56_2147 [Sinobacterium caligoides]